MEKERITINEEENTESVEVEAHLADETEAKEADSKNIKVACECFGYNEEGTEEWAVRAMAIWHNVITGFWIALGMLSFAPVTFISRKLNGLIEKTWIRLVVAIAIYVFILFLPKLIKLCV